MESAYITLHCKHCENDNCIFYPIGSYIVGNEGCTRQITEEDSIRYEHYIKEEIPFWKNYERPHIDRKTKQIEDFLFSKIYCAPVGKVLDKMGKVSKK